MATNQTPPRWREVHDLTRPVRVPLTAATIAAFLSGMASVAPYIAVAFLAYELLNSDSISTTIIWVTVGLAIGALILRQVLQHLATVLCQVAQARFRRHLRTRLTAHLSHLPLGWFTNRAATEVRKSVTDDVNTIQGLLVLVGVELAGAIAAPTAGLIYLFIIDWHMSLILVGYFAIVLIIGGLVLRWRQATGTWNDRSEATADLAAATVELVDGIQEVKNFRLHDAVFARLDDASERSAAATYRWLAGPGVPMAFLQAMVLPVGMVVPILLGGWLFVAGQVIHPVTVIPFLLVGLTIPTSVLNAARLTTQISEALLVCGSTLNILATPELSEPRTPAPLSGAGLSYDNVSFWYEEGRPVLSQIDLSLAPGTVTALVGPSGSGKSTLVQLAARFWDASAGSVRIGDRDVRELSSADLLSQVAIVFQDVTLFYGSVLENIRLARPGASRKQVAAAAQAARIHNRIMELPQGYDTVLGTEEVQLSIGERQRLTIARAFLSDAPILLLDEATAYADPDSEHDIQRALAALGRGRTVLVIAHRLHAITGADKIVVLDSGRIVEAGTHDELVTAAGLYAQLWHAQHQDLLPELGGSCDS